MMSFEDIVDMDWLDSHSIKGEPMDLFPSDLSDFSQYFDEQATSTSAMINNNPLTSCSAAALAAAASVPPPPLTFPSTEQIKQLIELAKHQLAIRQAAAALIQTKAVKDEQVDDDKKTAAQDKKQLNSDDAGDPLSHNGDHLAVAAAAAAADSTLFSTNHDDLPDTVSPESLMKPASPIHTSATSMPPASAPVSSPLQQATPSTQQKNKTSTSMAVTDDDDDMLSDLPDKKSRRDSLGDDPLVSLEAFAESDGIDIKKLTPKERRQLRNKISARNFRVRRKEYITTLEQQVNEHKKHAEQLIEKLSKMDDENRQLRQEVDYLKQQNLLLQQQQVVC
ncbi:hypothetical protein BC940DRAFT_296818 [Gongronella butleri]|nr:hypothetical protein BC940DRAFT_296818 [Gongronella butleri]